MFHVVVVEYNVEPWVLRDGNGSYLSIPDWDRRGSGRRRPTGDSGSMAHNLLLWENRTGKGLTKTLLTVLPVPLTHSLLEGA